MSDSVGSPTRSDLVPTWIRIALGVLGALVWTMVSSCHSSPPPRAHAPSDDIGRYEFAHVNPEQPWARNDVDGTTGLVYSATARGNEVAEPLRHIVEEDGTAAVRLDRGCLAGPVPGNFSTGFTIAVWVRILGQGSLFGNAGASNGTVFAVGNGYSDGARMTWDSLRHTLTFSLGQPQPPHAISVSTVPLVTGTWMHLTASWDGGRMRVFVDGVPVAERPARVSYQRPSPNVLRLGYANAGVGSLRMDAAQLRVFARPLRPVEVLQLAAREETLELPFAELYDRVANQLSESDPADISALVRRARRQPPAVQWRTLWVALQASRAVHDHARELTCLAQVCPPEGCWVEREWQRLLTQKLAEGPHDGWPQALWKRMEELPSLSAPDRARLDLLRAMAELESGHVDAGRNRLLALAETGTAPWKSTAALILARWALDRGQPEEAARWLQRVQSDSEAPLAHHDEAACALQRLRSGSFGAERLSPLPELPTTDLQVYVAPNGDDRNPGTHERPVATLLRARDLLREHRAGPNSNCSATVWIAPGRYPVQATLTLDARDSGRPDAPIIWRAMDLNRPPQFDGGLRVRPRPVSEALRSRLDPAAQPYAVEFDLAAHGLTNPPPLVLRGWGSGRAGRLAPTLELFRGDQALPRSRWPNQGFANVTAVYGTNPVVEHGRAVASSSREGYVGLDTDRLVRWVGESDLWLYGYWFHRWSDSYERVARISPQDRRVDLDPPWHRSGFRVGGLWCAVNAVSEIDRPGEWAWSSAHGVIVAWPPEGTQDTEWIVSVWPSTMLEATGLSHVVWVGLTWQYGAADGIRWTRCSNCALLGCTVRHFAGTGLIIDGGQSNRVRSCDVYNLGREGIVVRGGDRRTLVPGGHQVENCHIHHVSRIDHTYSPSVLVAGVGHRIAHNLLHDNHSSALRVEGNDHRIELNEIYDVVLESDDQGGSDSWGNPTYRGNVFVHNYWHHIGRHPAANMTAEVGRAAIRLDDAISGTVIRGNVFFACGAGVGWCGSVQIHGGKDNEVDGNVVVAAPAVLSCTPWSESRWREFVTNFLQRLDVDSSLYTRRYPALTNLLAQANRNLLHRNWVFQCGSLTYRAPPALVVGANWVSSSPGPFRDPTRGDFRLAPKARWPLWLGPDPCPIEVVGLRTDAYRRTLPEAQVRSARSRAP